MKLVTAQQMANIDRRAIEEFGVPGIQLMERAGEGVFNLIKEVVGEVKGKEIGVFCGKGNNGGDGFVTARLLHQDGASVLVLLLGRKDDLRGDAEINLKKTLDLEIQVTEVLNEDDLSSVKEVLRSAELIVDALFGTGMRGVVKGLAASVIEMINNSSKPVISVDVPSGLSADGGQISGSCIQAMATATFGLPKVGQVFYPGKSRCGRLKIVDIGIPAEAVDQEGCRANLIMEGDVARLLPRRKPDVHKGDCGRIIVVAGSVGMTGAAALTSMAALRIGAGLVTLGVPASLNDILEVKLTEVMTRPLPEVRKRRCIALRAVGEIRRLLDGADCLAIGPGLGIHHETSELVRRIVKEASLPIVIDADGLNALAKDLSPLKDTAAEVVVTPHPGELSRITGRPVSEIASDPVMAATEFSGEFGVVVVLKGAPTVIAGPDGEFYVNWTGNAGMATGGSGDVLTGSIAGLIGQGLSPREASITAVFLHGKAGDIARDRKGEMGLVAGDILDLLPEAVIRVAEHNRRG